MAGSAPEHDVNHGLGPLRAAPLRLLPQQIRQGQAPQTERTGAEKLPKAVADAFRDVLPARHGAEALAALSERFSALAQRDDSIPCRAALEAVKTFGANSARDQIDDSLRTYADFVTRQYELAAKHATRRGQD